VFSRLLSEAAPSRPHNRTRPLSHHSVSSSSFQCTALVADWSRHPLMGVCCACVVCLVQRGAPLLVPLLHRRRRVALVYSTRHAFLPPPPPPLPLPLPPLPPFPLPPPPRCPLQRRPAATLPPPPCCCHRHAIATTLSPPMPPPRYRSRPAAAARRRRPAATLPR
jgi:hypothetical protein